MISGHMYSMGMYVFFRFHDRIIELEKRREEMKR